MRTAIELLSLVPLAGTAAGLPFGVLPAGDMFQRKIDELFQGLPNVFGIDDDIFIAGFNELGREIMKQ